MMDGLWLGDRSDAKDGKIRGSAGAPWSAFPSGMAASDQATLDGSSPS